MDLSEAELLVAIGRVFGADGPDVAVGPGDDAAVTTSGSGDLVLTTDALVEGVHFRRDLTTPRDLGYKAIAVNLSDLAAMAASPRYALCALTLSDDVDAAWVIELAGGMRECCDEFAVTLVGGNLARGRDVTIAVTATGEVVPGRGGRRVRAPAGARRGGPRPGGGARPGDRLVVTGRLGGAAAGLRLAARRSWTDDERDALRRHVRPTPRVGEAGVLASHGATSLIDVSDGLALDLARLCEASGVGARVDLAGVPVHPAAMLDEAMAGGEDYELLGTVPSDDAVAAARSQLAEAFGVPLAEIGRIIETGLVAVEPDGTERPLQPEGWDHFR